MMRSERKAANSMGGKTARACDGCLRKRARWYCVADDAFLCQACDASVHSANQLASRHERVRLEAASFSNKFNEYNNKDSAAAPVWHQGFTRKARTPRPIYKNDKAMVVTCSNSNDQSLVPEIGSEEGSLQDEVVTEEQLLYQVPVLDPCDLDDLHGFLPSDMDLGELAADMESLLGIGLDEDSYDVKELGLLDCKEEKIALKIKDEEVVEGVSATREALIEYWNFDDDDHHQSKAATDQVPEMKRNISLKLNYDAVITAWASQGCPWITGSRPDFNPNEYGWPDCMGSCYQNVHHHPFGGGGGSDGGREARVSRYREKRRTRLFSKKIRYQVRKLNAEKRPRMKGRFVKRTSFLAANAFSLTQ